MTMLPNIEEAMEDARNGKLSPYWQNDLYRECHRQKLSDEEQQALSELERILSETPQWSSEEELHHDMANIGGRVWYCHYWEEHYSMVQLTEDRNGRFNTGNAPGGCTAGAEGACGMYAEMGHYASGCACS